VTDEEKMRNYARCLILTEETVRDWKDRAPKFQFPPKEFAFLASLRAAGRKVAVDGNARELVAELIKRVDDIKTAEGRDAIDYPTVMMLQAILDTHEIPYAVMPGNVLFEER
jgi:hypothetical protein